MSPACDLYVEIDGKENFKVLTLTVDAGELRAIIGPNGAGKSTLGGAERRR